MPRLRLFIILLLALLPLAYEPSALAQEGVTLAGVLRNGTVSAPFTPEGVRVDLRMLEGTVVVDQQFATAEGDGQFSFPGLLPTTDRLYFLSAEYQGAVYSATVEAPLLAEPVSLTVYESTSDQDVLTVTTYSVIVTGSDANERLVEVLERVTIENRTDTTLVPDMDGVGAMGFLRFGLPPDYSNLDVRSDLVGGQILEVDRGFALTTPVPPTTEGQSHQVEFIYRLRYLGTTIDLGRSLPFGAEAFRVVVPNNAAQGLSPRLADLGVALLDDREFQLLEGTLLARGERLELQLVGLPEPSAMLQLGRSVGRWYLLIGVPTITTLALAGALFLGLRRRRHSASAAVAPEDRRQALLQRLATLEAQRSQGDMSQRRYSSERDVVLEELLELEVQRRLDGA